MTPHPPWLRLTLWAPPEVREALGSLLVDWGAPGTAEEADTLTTWFPSAERGGVEERLRRYVLDLGAPIGWRWDDEPDEGWRDRWKAFYRPARVSARLGVCPTWEAWPPDLGDAEVIRLDPGRAFGTGTHETTRLCLRLLDEELAARSGAPPVLDVGCGSGILSIGALLLGACRAVALDIDPLAAQAAAQNARINGVADRMRVVCGDLRGVEGRHPVVVANILYQVLLGLAPELARRVAPGGTLILSGLLTAEAGSAAAVYGGQGLEPVDRRDEGEWAALVFRNPG